MEDRQTISVMRRLGSMLLDHMLICATMIPPVVVLIALAIRSPQDRVLLDQYGGPLLGGILFIYLNKDWFGGRSAAKRILSLQVVNRVDGTPASELKCLLRNMTIPLWPIEGVVSLFSRSRRIGDLIAGTKVISVDSAARNSFKQDFRAYRPTVRSFLAVLLTLTYILVSMRLSI